MTTSGDRPDRAARVSRALAGVVIGFVGLALVGLIVVVIGYNVLVSGWADQYDSDGQVVVDGGSGDPAALGTDAGEATDVVGQGSGPDEGSGLDASNEAYRQRVGTPEGDAEAALALPEVQTALDPLAAGGPVDRDAVVAALVGAGFDGVQVTPEESPLGTRATSFGVGVAVPGGCVFGEVAPAGVTLEAGGPIADGGCLEMPTH
ncbi:DUF6993 domain-containing protein [Cellulosimicrobium arenosum]|uniref:DUF6993 domain-containing protein n=1 Tax=Cellulosimicrobium arenosum TaxID=2708133 RepID=A0A927J0N8_9MICO|nr:hypothetical protein [Cellulosimicrobium arenosum]MBD8079635.1 hypothetical protein [Cellulosimicrobium arenosum]